MNNVKFRYSNEYIEFMRYVDEYFDGSSDKRIASDVMAMAFGSCAPDMLSVVRRFRSHGRIDYCVSFKHHIRTPDNSDFKFTMHKW